MISLQTLTCTERGQIHEVMLDLETYATGYANKGSQIEGNFTLYRSGFLVHLLSICDACSYILLNVSHSDMREHYLLTKLII